jgi:hypothetical protein
MIVDKGTDFPHAIDTSLRSYGENMWFFREQPGTLTTRARNTYTGDHREYVPGGHFPARTFSSHASLDTWFLYFFLKLSIPYP